KQVIKVKDADQDISVNIPLDGEEKKVVPNGKVVRNHILRQVRNNAALIGTVASLVSFLITPTILFAVLIGVHIAMYLLFAALDKKKKEKAWGTIIDSKTKAKLPYTVVRLYDTKTQRLLDTKVSTYQGQYAFLARGGQFTIDSQKTGYKQETREIDITSKNFTQTVTEDIKMTAGIGEVGQVAAEAKTA
ncbi:unnamed protein product, partial [marine sediment metagenome]